MQCKTERCLIRELVPDDWKSMQKIAVDFRKSKYAVYDMPLPEEDAEIIARTKQFAQTTDVLCGFAPRRDDWVYLFSRRSRNVRLGLLFPFGLPGKGVRL